MAAPLEEYKKKRDFKKTREPAGAPVKPARKTKRAGLFFCIQKHAASHLHYDFRLELEGVLKSWAVPKGPSLDPQDKRLAMHVEDHPLEYGNFEGIIPAGEYGGGTVVLWDRGTWTPLGNAHEDYRKGMLKFTLHGEKLRGGYMLVRMGKADARGKESWLLRKETDAEARPGGPPLVEERPESVLTGRTLEQIAEAADSVWHSNRVGRAEALEHDRFAGKRAARAGAARAKGAAKSGAHAKKPAPAKTARAAVAAASLAGARRAALPPGEALEAALATAVTQVPQGPGWIHEIKLDGYRILARIERGEVTLWSRNHNDWTGRFAAVAAAARELGVDSALLDGEVVVVEPDGTTSFQALQNVLRGAREKDLAYYVFDLIHLDGHDLRAVPLLERKRALHALIGADDADGADLIRYTDHVEGSGEEVWRAACGLKLEGIVSKRADAPYSAGRGKDWVKVKCTQRQELVVGGFTEPDGTRSGFGALLLGVHDDDGRLVYAGKVGTGFTERTLADLAKRLKPIARKTSPFADPPKGYMARGVHWVEPELVVEVEFAEWTGDGHLRHPSYQGLRADKEPGEVVREQAVRPPAPQSLGAAAEDEPEAQRRPRSRRASGEKGSAASTPRKVTAGTARAGKGTAAPPSAAAAAPVAPVVPTGAAPAKRSARASVPIPHPAGAAGGGPGEVEGVRLTHPERVLYPDEGITKEELAHFYVGIAERVLPYLADRPLTLVRCPDGFGKECFFQKHAIMSTPKAIRRIRLPEKEGKDHLFLAVDDLAGLLSAVQMSVLELHIWNSRMATLERPDQFVIDLDPDPEVEWSRVVEAAYLIAKRVADAGLVPFVKTTGGKGLHVVVPIVPELGWDEVREVSQALSEGVVASHPHGYVATMAKVKRKGKIFLDYFRNTRTATAIAPWSTRARAGAPVATPLTWDQLADVPGGNAFTVRNLAAHLAALEADPWADFDASRGRLTAKVRKSLGVK